MENLQVKCSNSLFYVSAHIKHGKTNKYLYNRLKCSIIQPPFLHLFFAILSKMASELKIGKDGKPDVLLTML